MPGGLSSKTPIARWSDIVASMLIFYRRYRRGTDLPERNRNKPGRLIRRFVIPKSNDISSALLAPMPTALQSTTAAPRAFPKLPKQERFDPRSLAGSDSARPPAD
jgi:hypothetical protein